jgi:hypothetical protein
MKKYMDSFLTEPTPNQLFFSHPQLVCSYSREGLIAKTIAHISAFDREVEKNQILLYPTPIRTTTDYFRYEIL